MLSALSQFILLSAKIRDYFRFVRCTHTGLADVILAQHAILAAVVSNIPELAIAFSAVAFVYQMTTRFSHPS
ncbi:MAG: hypothetical protein KME45_17450 [Stenomitos rutilans HA7619-LM2]|nr:hypothetical protein [Stenomitos rutilans HA7619-LM2]